jgi:protein unc-45
MVAQGAMRLLLDLSGHPSEKAADAAALALARIGVSTDPHLFPSEAAFAMIPPLLRLITRAPHELHIFEAVLALTNLGSFDEDMRSAMVRAGAWYEMLTLLGAENERIQRAALQCITNMVSCEAAIKRYGTYVLPGRGKRVPCLSVL